MENEHYPISDTQIKAIQDAINVPRIHYVIRSVGKGWGKTIAAAFPTLDDLGQRNENRESPLAGQQTTQAKDC